MRYRFEWGVLWQYRRALLHGFLLTLGLSVAGLAGAIALGILLGTGSAGERRWLRIACGGYVELCRSVPLLVHMYFWYLGLSALKVPGFWCAVLALTFYSGAFVAEVVRSGIQSVPQGQWAAGLASGLTRRQTLHSIVYPQAARIVAPSLAGIFSQLIKDSSLASVISVAELTFQAGAIEGVTFRTFEAYVGVSLLYLVIVSTISQITLFLFHRRAVDMTAYV
ncbi:MAG TPA: amino acid ABC transporter permease [Candidatus Sulfotelmatobacter sp.]|nr:amino acid ABC transporter permease [Candidatus Sulfotelmatobacter sp.]